jgi:methyl-accepting chemotaxis protein
MASGWTVGRKLTVAFAVMVVLLATSSLTGVVDSFQSRRALEATSSLAASSRSAAEVEAFVRSLDGSQKLILVAGLTGVVERSEAGLKGVKTASAELAARLEQLKSAAMSDEGHALVGDIATKVKAWQTLHERVLALIEKQDFDTALTVDLTESFAVQAKIVEDAEALQRVLTKDAEANTAAARATFLTSVTIATVVVILAVIVGVVVALVIRQITRALAAAASELRSASQEVTTTSEQVASSSQLLSQGATSQAASLEETSASMEEMASMTRRNAENSQSAAGQVAETERLVAGANQALRDLVSSMATIRDSSSQVTKIIKTIDEIAFQTNILALNAAVEAARAGEAGMGFAVVADEVRNLAQRSAQAAKDTATLIEASAANAASGGAKVDAVVDVMSSITESSARVRGLVEEVSVASRQQSQGIDQVTQAITQMEKVTQTTAATAEECAAASGELNSQASNSLAVVVRLEGMVHGQSRGAGASASTGAVVAFPARARAQRPASAPADPFPLDPTGTDGGF